MNTEPDEYHCACRHGYSGKTCEIGESPAVHRKHTGRREEVRREEVRKGGDEEVGWELLYLCPIVPWPRRDAA